MSKRSKKWYLENIHFINKETNKIQYADKCKNCTHECKQSYKVILISCTDFEREKNNDRRL